ncbi:MAG TPA: hypothetical protein VGF50_10275 [Caulobacteraceae bacterium]|jgi:hypothetical protein
MRRLDWFLAAVIGAFLLAWATAQAMSHAMLDLAAGATGSAPQSFVERLVSPSGDPISVQCPMLLRRG